MSHLEALRQEARWSALLHFQHHVVPIDQLHTSILHVPQLQGYSHAPRVAQQHEAVSTLQHDAKADNAFMAQQEAQLKTIRGSKSAAGPND